jgi:hypothetical protein
VYVAKEELAATAAARAIFLSILSPCINEFV